MLDLYCIRKAKLSYVGDYCTGYGSTKVRPNYSTIKVVTVQAGLEARGFNVTFSAGATPFDRANKSSISLAVAKARDADVVVMVIGDSSNGDGPVEHDYIIKIVAQNLDSRCGLIFVLMIESRRLDQTTYRIPAP